MLHDIRTLNQKNEDLNRTLDSTVQQRDKERLEITSLNVKLRELQTDTERVVAALKGSLFIHILITVKQNKSKILNFL